jgi:hypothetical protein
LQPLASLLLVKSYPLTLGSIKNMRNPIILLSELTISLVLSNPPASLGNSTKEDDLAVFIRLFCRIEVLAFTGIEIAFILENYADNGHTAGSNNMGPGRSVFRCFSQCEKHCCDRRDYATLGVIVISRNLPLRSTIAL